MINEQDRLDATKPMFMVTTDDELWQEFNDTIALMNGLKSTFQNNGVTLSFEQSVHVYAMFTEIGNKLIQLEQSSMKHLVHLKGDENIVNGIVHTVREPKLPFEQEKFNTQPLSRPADLNPPVDKTYTSSKENIKECEESRAKCKDGDPDQYRIKPSGFDNDHGVEVNVSRGWFT